MRWCVAQSKFRDGKELKKRKPQNLPNPTPPKLPSTAFAGEPVRSRGAIERTSFLVPFFKKRNKKKHKKSSTYFNAVFPVYKPTFSVIKRTFSPHKSTLSVVKRTLSPHKSTLSVVKRTSPPHKSTLSVIKRTLSPHKSILSFVKRTLSLHKSSFTSPVTIVCPQFPNSQVP